MTQLRTLNPRRYSNATRWKSDTSSQTLANATWTAVEVPSNYAQWGGPGSVPQVQIWTGNYSIRMTEAGIYHMEANAGFNQNSSGRRQFGLQITATLDPGTISNAEIIERTEVGVQNGWSMTPMAVRQTTSLQFARFVAWQNSGGNLNLNTTPNAIPTFYVERLDQYHYVP